MPIIYSYPPTNSIANDDTFVITKEIEDENRIETRSISFESLKSVIRREVQSTTFVFTQGMVSRVWDIQHNTDKFPSVEVVDTQETSILGFQIEYINSNRLILTFILPFAGKAFLN